MRVKNVEELFLNHSANFKRELEKVMQEYYGDFVNEYLPYVGDDADSNVWHRCYEHFTDILSGKLDKLPYPLDDIGGRQVRAKIFEDFKDELVELLNDDHLKRIAELEEQLRWANGALIRRY